MAKIDLKAIVLCFFILILILLCQYAILPKKSNKKLFF